MILPEKYKNIFGWFNYPDLYLQEAKKHKTEKGVFVEVGSFYGKSTAFMTELIKMNNLNIEFHTVDTFMGSEEHKNTSLSRVCDKDGSFYKFFLRNLGDLKQYVQIHKGKSIEISKEFKNETIDFIMIDASHQTEDVINDLDYWYPKVKKGGLISGDDYAWDSVSTAVKRWCSKRNYQYQLNKDKIIWSFIKR